MADGKFAWAKTSVWWDIENCAVPKGFDALNIARNISEALANEGYRGEVAIKAYGDITSMHKNVPTALNSSGVALNYVPAGAKDNADKKILVDMLLWAHENPPPANFLLISGDRDFSNALHKLRMKQYNILLAHAPNVSPALIAAASCVWSWSSLVAGGSSRKAESSIRSGGTDTGSGDSSESLEVEQTQNANGNANGNHEGPAKLTSKAPTKYITGPGMQVDQVSAFDQLSETHGNAQSKNNAGNVVSLSVSSAPLSEPDKEARSFKSAPHKFFDNNSTLCAGSMTNTTSSSTVFRPNSGKSKVRPAQAFIRPGNFHGSSFRGNSFPPHPRGTNGPPFGNPPPPPRGNSFHPQPRGTNGPPFHAIPDISRLNMSEHSIREQQRPVAYQHNPEMMPRFSGTPQYNNPQKNFRHCPPRAINGNTYGFSEPHKEARSFKSAPHKFFDNNGTLCTGSMTNTSSSSNSVFRPNSGKNQVFWPTSTLISSEKNSTQPPFTTPGNFHASSSLGNSFPPQPRGTDGPPFGNPPPPQPPQAVMTPYSSTPNIRHTFEHPIRDIRPISYQHNPGTRPLFSGTTQVNGKSCGGFEGQIFPNSTPEPELQFHINTILHALQILKMDQMPPTTTNIADCIHFGETKHPNFNVKLGLDYALKHHMIVEYSIGNCSLFTPRNDKVWNCLNLMDSNAKHPKATWDKVQKYLSSSIGRTVFLRTRCRYEAAMVLKTNCLENLPLGIVFQVLQTAVTIKKWIVPHSSGWQPIAVNLPLSQTK